MDTFLYVMSVKEMYTCAYVCTFFTFVMFAQDAGAQRAELWVHVCWGSIPWIDRNKSCQRLLLTISDAEWEALRCHLWQLKRDCHFDPEGKWSSGAETPSVGIRKEAWKHAGSHTAEERSYSSGGGCYIWNCKTTAACIDIVTAMTWICAESPVRVYQGLIGLFHSSHCVEALHELIQSLMHPCSCHIAVLSTLTARLICLPKVP